MSRDALPYEDGCQQCAELEAAERAARAERDVTREVDARVMGRRHLRHVHGIATVVRP